ncbi:hypothetical protein GGR28_003658 [Lewinella aquimaris]|uniref:Alpha-2-macroglobulin family protein n=1 Tax=Neolewinella aquimaris TaxID=1835722 RepID=A0A840EC38_9BACT|nr:MG2 domain-containing protein [Neolewinella aquimaris]MBB4081017.1 hypothetical protein [Neolewinella aquimaris]
MRAVLFLLLVALLAGCREKTEAVAATEAPPAHVLSHTSGVIGRSADLFVTFDTVYTFGEGEGPALEVRPRVAGELTLTGRQLVFRPTQALTSGTDYSATVSLPGKPDFTFSFRVPDRRLEVESDGYYIPDPSRPERVEVTGRVVTNDGADPDEIRRVLRIEHNRDPLDFSLEQSSQNVFSYVGTLPDRGSEPSIVTVTVAADQGGFAGATYTREVQIRPVGAFEVLSVQLRPDGGGITIRMSDPVEESQDLTGLLRFRPDVAFSTTVDGNIIHLYPTQADAREAVLVVEPQLRSTAGQDLGQRTEWQVSLGHTDPGLRAVGEGSIMPHEGQRLFTFEAVGLSTVYLELFRIDAGNLLQFLQDENLSSTSHEWSLRRVGRIVARREVPLTSLAPGADQSRWTRYAIDLSSYLERDDAAVYQLRLAFGMEYTDQACGVSTESLGLQTISDLLGRSDPPPTGFDPATSLLSNYYGIYDYSDWEQRDNPCSPAFYHRDRFLIRNVLSSNLGLIAKRQPNRETLVFSTNLITGGPQGGVRVTAYSYDQRELFSGTTDAEGKVGMTTEDEPAFIVGSLNQEAAYLSINEGEALPVGRFEVGGGEANSGIRGAFFGERGVWRPGDSVFLNFVLADKSNLLPTDYPVAFTLRDARGRVVQRRRVTSPFGSGLYPLTFRTDPTDVTGTWSATVTAGARTYTHPLLIEAVKPNRLSIDLRAAEGRDKLLLSGNWLYGAPAAGLRAEINMQPFARTLDAGSLPDFVFQDPARSLGDVQESQLFNGRLDSRGRAELTLPPLGEALPGPLQLRLNTKVFEPGGNFSIDRTTVPYDPFPVYAGLRLPMSEWGSKSLPTEGTAGMEVAAVDPEGRGVAGRKLTIGIYRVDWRYWWQDGNDNVARFGSSQHTEALETRTATTDANGRATLQVGVNDYGRYLIRVCDQGGHCAGDYFYGGSGESGLDDRESASLLHLRAEHETVNTGEPVTINVPTSAGGQLLVSLETSLGSLEQFWVPAAAGQTQVTFTTDERMVPTVYANITYLQPYAQTTNDRPVRLFGIVPVEVLDPTTRLQPEITAASEWKPRQTVEVKISEADNRPMTYVLSVVDEGLLGLTRFATPDLHRDFFSKEALAVRTYDLYDHVMSSINGEFGRVLAIGGDGTVVNPEEETANRFEPVVRHLGPFQLAGGTASHRISLPNYLGAVRIMVVAVGDRAYGSAETKVAVRQPLMVLPTLPRVLGPGERVDMPVNVFAMNDRLDRVKVTVSESAGLVDPGNGQTDLQFSGAGDRLAYLPLQVGERTGIARFDVTASGGGEASSQQIEIDVREPNRITTRTSTVSIPPGEARTVSYSLFGIPDSRSASLEMSSLPAMNLNRHLEYLLRYPYGCAEQTISTAFAQLVLDRITELTPVQETRRRTNVAAAVETLRHFRTASGGIGYWPGSQQVHPWVTSYALQFILEAERAGFAVPYDLKEELISFQETAAARWNRSDGAFYASLQQRSLDQAYRLYTLALAQRPDVGAMNRLRGLSKELTATATYQLAGAYAISGRQRTAESLVTGRDVAIPPYQELGYTFGSEIRDMAIVLESMVAMADRGAVDEQTLQLARAIGERQWLNTQEAAFAFVALAKTGATGAGALRADFTSSTGATTAVGSASGIFTIDLPISGDLNYTVSNTGQSTLYLTTHTRGKPRAGEEEATSRQLRLAVAYTDLTGNPIDVANLASGTDFLASYRITNPGTTGQDYHQLALTTLLPSGWEVANDRLAGRDSLNASFEYRDIRDDRIHTFFDLPARHTKTFTFRMTAAYPGRYYLPTQVSEAMYDPTVRSEVKGRWVEVKRER